MEKKVLCVLAEGFEEIEAVTPVDFLRRAGIDVTVAGIGGIDVTGSHGITVLADCEFSEIDEEFDGIVIPGGIPGAPNLASDEQVLGYIRKMADAGKLVAAICAAPAVVLGKAGVLSGRKATSAPSFVDKLPSDCEFTGERVTTDRNIITSRAAGTAAEFAAAIVAWFAGRENASKLLESMLYK